MKPLFIAIGISCVIAIVLSYVLGGTKGLLGMGMGLGSTAFNIGAFRLALYVVGRTIEETKQVDAAAVFGLTALLIKLPIWCVCAMIAQRMGGAVLNGFLAGLGLVYCAAVGWVIVKNC